MSPPGREAPTPGPDRIGGAEGRGKGRSGPSGPRRPWTLPLLAYLLAGLPLLGGAVAAGAPGWPAFLPFHLVLLAWTWRLHRRPGPGWDVAEEKAGRGRSPGARAATALADWTFPLALPFLYAELPVLMDGLPGPVAFHDAAVLAFETRVFGVVPPHVWAGSLPVGWLSELLHLGYVSYYALVVVPPALLWAGLTGPRDPAARGFAFHRTVLALTLAMLPAFALMVVWPVQGPRWFGPPPGVPDGPVRALALAVLEAGSSRGAAFPSSHVSLAVAQAALALRWQRPVGVAAAVLTVLLSAGAVYGGFHYLTDVVAGIAVGSLAAAAALRTPGGAADAPHPPDPTRETPPAERG